jgi:hypothetical protein
MKKRKPAATVKPAFSPPGWALTEYFETVQVIPASGVTARYKDGEEYPVIAWALQARSERDSGEVITRVVGLTMCEKSPVLIDVDDPMIGGDMDFDGYGWRLHK